MRNVEMKLNTNLSNHQIINICQDYFSFTYPFAFGE